jgi:hypothetical protein
VTVHHPVLRSRVIWVDNFQEKKESASYGMGNDGIRKRFFIILVCIMLSNTYIPQYLATSYMFYI